MEQKIFAFRSNWKMDVDLYTQKIFACPIGGKERERKEVFCILFLEVEAAVQAIPATGVSNGMAGGADLY